MGEGSRRKERSGREESQVNKVRRRRSGEHVGGERRRRDG